MSLDYLTYNQKQQIRKQAKETCIEDAQNDADYLGQIIDQRIGGMSVEDQLLVITSDPDMLPTFLDFDPLTGEDWNFDDE